MLRHIPCSLWRMRRRCGLRVFLVTLCAVYFAAMFVFQSSLYTGQPHQRAADSDDARRWARVGADEFATQPELVNVDRNRKSERLNGDVVMQQAFDNMRQGDLGQRRTRIRAPTRSAADDIPVLRQWRLDPANNVDNNEFNVPPSCGRDKVDRELEFVELHGVLLYSAYWDSRPNDFDNRINGSLVRIMAIIRGGDRPGLECRWPGLRDTVDMTTEISYYEMCENHGRPQGSFVLSCRVPDHVTEPTCHVTVVANKETVRVPVRTLRPVRDENMNQFTVCVPPLFGAVPVSRLVEFFELTFILGADRIVMYDYNVPDIVRRVLKQYSTTHCRHAKHRCHVDLIPWRLPEDVDRGIWYHGQSISIMDCLYRHMAVSKHVMFNDIDEFIVPHADNMISLDDMVDQLLLPGRCALQFVSAFYDPGIQSASDVATVYDEWGQPKVSPIETSELLSLTALKRSRDFSTLRTKCLVRPYEIFEAGIHHISKPIWANLEVHRVDTNIAFLHHYRNCVGNMGMNCFGAVDDDTMLRYGDELKQRVNESTSQLNSVL